MNMEGKTADYESPLEKLIAACDKRIRELEAERDVLQRQFNDAVELVKGEIKTVRTLTADNTRLREVIEWAKPHIKASCNCEDASCLCRQVFHGLDRALAPQPAKEGE